MVAAGGGGGSRQGWPRQAAAAAAEGTGGGGGGPSRTSNQKSQVLWPKITGEVAQQTRLCGSISHVEDLHRPQERLTGIHVA